MHQITTHLVKLAEEANVEIKYNTTVETLNVESNNRLPLIVMVSYPFDIVASDIDIHALYKYLLPNSFTLSYFNKKNLVVPMFFIGNKKNLQH
jgi:phytoene dehydrogenase-like protein